MCIRLTVSSSVMRRLVCMSQCCQHSPVFWPSGNTQWAPFEKTEIRGTQLPDVQKFAQIVLARITCTARKLFLQLVPKDNVVNSVVPSYGLEHLDCYWNPRAQPMWLINKALFYINHASLLAKVRTDCKTCDKHWTQKTDFLKLHAKYWFPCPTLQGMSETY